MSDRKQQRLEELAEAACTWLIKWREVKNATSFDELEHADAELSKAEANLAAKIEDIERLSVDSVLSSTLCG